MAGFAFGGATVLFLGGCFSAAVIGWWSTVRALSMSTFNHLQAAFVHLHLLLFFLGKCRLWLFVFSHLNSPYYVSLSRSGAAGPTSREFSRIEASGILL